MVSFAIVLAIPTFAFAQPPSNDDFANATVIPSLPFQDYYQDTTEATSSPSDPLSCPDFGGGPDGATVWYSFTPSKDMKVRADTEGSALDEEFKTYQIVLSVWTGQPGNFSPVACNDYTPWAGSQVVFDAVKGVPYYFMIGTANGGPGGIQLAFSVKEVFKVLRQPSTRQARSRMGSPRLGNHLVHPR